VCAEADHEGVEGDYADEGGFSLDLRKYGYGMCHACGVACEEKRDDGERRKRYGYEEGFCVVEQFLDYSEVQVDCHDVR
jgi:hypothetical protein